jgi:hypothetical protein
MRSVRQHNRKVKLSSRRALLIAVLALLGLAGGGVVWTAWQPATLRVSDDHAIYFGGNREYNGFSLAGYSSPPSGLCVRREFGYRTSGAYYRLTLRVSDWYYEVSAW